MPGTCPLPSNITHQYLREICEICVKSLIHHPFKSKSYIALKAAIESLYWLNLLHSNDYVTDVQYNSLYADCEELVKLLTHSCKKLDGVE